MIVSRSQTGFFFYIGTGKGSGTLNSKFLFRLPPKLGWAMIGDDYERYEQTQCDHRANHLLEVFVTLRR